MAIESGQQRANRRMRDAIEQANLKKFRAAIKSGADINDRDDFGLLPIVGAVYENAIEIVKDLIARGQDVNDASPEGWTAMHEAARGGKVELIQLLAESGAAISPLCVHESEPGFPIHMAHERAVDLLLSLGAGTDVRDHNWRTPLHRRVMDGDAIGIAALLKAGADPLPLDRDGKTPLDYLNPKSMHYQDVLDALAPVFAIQAERDHADRTAPATGSHRGTRL